MSRALEFNLEKALKVATKVFWVQGYKKASVQSLMKAMKIGEGSFYNTYKSKKKLYLLCLENYNKNVTNHRIQALQTDKHIGLRVRDFFNLVIQDQIKAGRSKGCMMTNSLSYEVLNDKDLKEYVEREICSFRNLFRDLFEEAKVNGELESSFDSQAVSELIIVHLQGIFKITLIQKEFGDLERHIDLLLTSLGL